jgi:glycosyltransferase involved in cell wall biosynthesis
MEFSLALHEKTGKYFIGREIVAAAADLIDRQLFWRLSFPSVPEGLSARVIGRLLAIEVNARVRSPLIDQIAPRQRTRRPVLHMDAFTTLLHDLSARDMVICHDVGPLSHADLFDPSVVAAYREAYAKIAAVGPHMVFISLASQAAFHARFGDAFASSRVIYPSLRAEVTGGDQTPVAGIDTPFLLTVGSVGDRKNQKRAIEAFAQSGLAARGVSYVLCGGREPGYEAVVEVARRTPGVHLFGYVDDQALNWLYDAAAGFVLPSLLEGFGVPVAEAIMRGLIPLVSAESVLHEVAGHGALLVDPESTDQIAAAMRSLIIMPREEADERRKALALQPGRFAPEVAAGQWREAIERVIATAERA